MYHVGMGIATKVQSCVLRITVNSFIPAFVLRQTDVFLLAYCDKQLYNV